MANSNNGNNDPARGLVSAGVNTGLNLVSTYLNLKNWKNQTNAINTTLTSIADSFENQADTLYLQYQQQREQAAYNLEQSELSNLKAKGTAQASAASSGVAGNSISNLFRGYDRASAIDRYNTARNLDNLNKQYTTNLSGLQAQALNSLYSVKTPEIKGLQLDTKAIESLLSNLRIGANFKYTTGDRIDTRETLPDDILFA